MTTETTPKIKGLARTMAVAIHTSYTDKTYEAASVMTLSGLEAYILQSLEKNFSHTPNAHFDFGGVDD